jgi:hypothetical protein
MKKLIEWFKFQYAKCVLKSNNICLEHLLPETWENNPVSNTWEPYIRICPECLKKIQAEDKERWKKRFATLNEEEKELNKAILYIKNRK